MAKSNPTKCSIHDVRACVCFYFSFVLIYTTIIRHQCTNPLYSSFSLPPLSATFPLRYGSMYA